MVNILYQKIIEDNMLGAFAKMVSLDSVTTSLEVDIIPNYEVAKYEGPIDKEYPISDILDLSEEFQYISSVSLLKAGYEVDGEFYEDKGDGIGEISLSIFSLNERKRTVGVHGTVVANSRSIDDGIPAVAKMKVKGVKSDRELSLLESLVIEGHALFMEQSYRMSFFTFFTALEALTSELLEDYRLKVHSELHHALEHLSLDEKMRIVAKEIWGAEKLKEVKIWGEFMGLLKSVKGLRNDLAHGKSFVAIAESNVLNVFCLVCAMYSFNKGVSGAKGLGNFYYPPRKSGK